MKFTLTVKNIGEPDSKSWEELYNKNTNDAEALGREFVDFFNATLKPGEKEREFIKVVIHDDTPETEYMDDLPF